MNSPIKYSSEDDVALKVLTVMASVFGVVAETIPKNASPGVFEIWDSLKHLYLISALEEEFAFVFTDDEMIDLLDFRLIVHVVFEKLQGLR